MRILVDTNVLISALLWPNSKPAQALLEIARNQTLVLCEQNISEFREVIKRKAPEALPAAEVFLEGLSFERLVSAEKSQQPIRDPKDQPILNAAIAGNVDIILTGDKDFLSLKLKHPRSMTVAEYLDKKR